MLTAHEAHYEVWRRGSKLGNLILTLVPEADGRYRYQASTEATSRLARLLRVGADEASHFEWKNQTLMPLHYQIETSRPGRQRFWEVDFDWAAGIARRSGDTDVPTTTLHEGIIDPLGLRLAMAMALAADPHRDTDLVFEVLERKRIETQTFRPGGFFNVTVPAGCLLALHLQRVHEDPDRILHAWHAPDLAWLPVRVQQWRDGREEMDLVLAGSDLLEHTGAECTP